MPQLQPSDMKVLVLCGGKGERLKPLTKSIPKPLVGIQDRPILSYLLSYFRKWGFRRFVIAVGHMADSFTNYFEDQHNDLDVEIVNSGDVDIVRRIQDALPILTENFIVVYGDTLADVDLDGLLRFHEQHEGDVTITGYPLESQFGLMELDRAQQVISFVEKPVLDRWINIGYYCFSRRIEESLKPSRRFVDFLQEITRQQRLHCYTHSGVHITVNTVTELQEAEKNISHFINNSRR